MRVMNLVSRLTTSEMSKNQKLHACWEYIVDDAGFQYGGSDPDLKKAGWCRKTALSMLNTKLEIAMDLPAHWQHLQKNWDIKR